MPDNGVFQILWDNRKCKKNFKAKLWDLWCQVGKFFKTNESRNVRSYLEINPDLRFHFLLRTLQKPPQKYALLSSLSKMIWAFRSSLSYPLSKVNCILWYRWQVSAVENRKMNSSLIYVFSCSVLLERFYVLARKVSGQNVSIQYAARNL